MAQKRQTDQFALSDEVIVENQVRVPANPAKGIESIDAQSQHLGQPVQCLVIRPLVRGPKQHLRYAQLSLVAMKCQRALELQLCQREYVVSRSTPTKCTQLPPGAVNEKQVQALRFHRCKNSRRNLLGIVVHKRAPQCESGTHEAHAAGTCGHSTRVKQRYFRATCHGHDCLPTGRIAHRLSRPREFRQRQPRCILCLLCQPHAPGPCRRRQLPDPHVKYRRQRQRHRHTPAPTSSVSNLSQRMPRPIRPCSPRQCLQRHHAIIAQHQTQPPRRKASAHGTAGAQNDVSGAGCHHCSSLKNNGTCLVASATTHPIEFSQIFIP